MPLLLLRKDAGVSAGNKFGRARGKDYRNRQAAFCSYLNGIGAQYIAMPKPRRRNVAATVTILLDRYSACDLVNQADALLDCLEGLVFDDDWQVAELSIGWRAGPTGLLFKIAEI